MRAQTNSTHVHGAAEESGALSAALNRVRRNGHRIDTEDGHTQTWRLSRRIQLQPSPEDGVGLVIDTYTARFCRCNGTAWSMLQALANGANLEDLVTAVTSEYQADEGIVQEDALDFIARLKRAEFVDEG